MPLACLFRVIGLTIHLRLRNHTGMGNEFRIPGIIFIFLCFSFLSFADEKVYTNKDLKKAPTLDRDSRIDPETGKVIKNEQDTSRKQAGAESIIDRAKNRAVIVINEIKSSKKTVPTMIGIISLIWLLCLLDILRFEFNGNNKLIWFIAVTFVPLIGCVLYLFIGQKQKKYRIIKDYER